MKSASLLVAILVSMPGYAQDQTKPDVAVSGEVLRPGTYSFREGLTLLQLVARAGGPVRTADVRRVEIRRRLPGFQGTAPKDVTITVDLRAVTSMKAEDIKLEASDVIYVPAGKSKGLPRESPTGDFPNRCLTCG